MNVSGRVLVGAIASVHGVKGQVKIKFFSENVDALLKRNDFSDASGLHLFKFKKHGITNGLVIVSIEGIDDRNVAEKLKGTEIYAPASDKTKLKTNQWTYGELTGLRARLENGTTYGKVTGIFNFGAGDIIEIELADGKTEMLPLRDEFIGAVNIEEGYLMVMPPDYVEAKE